jgi:RNA polymerase sigma factor (sigma-70 family)
MQELDTDYTQSLAQLFPQERARIVNLCAYLTGSRESAEDLAQEALIEAWRNRHKLVDPGGYSKWLSVVTRNVCLRWMRQQGRQSKNEGDLQEDVSDHTHLSSETLDLEIELERSELVDLLDRALAELPPVTHTALVNRYILEMPQAEIAGRLGISEGALEARLHRGKIILHSLLITELRPEAISYSLVNLQDGRWQETRIWCPICGQHKLYGTLPRAAGQFELHCPNCSWEPDAFFAQSKSTPLFNGVKGYKATLNRLMDFMVGYLQPGQNGANIPCNRCGKLVPLLFELPTYAHRYPNYGNLGMSVSCPACHASSYADIYGFALDTPAGQAFWRRNPKICTFPEQEIEKEGRAALRIRFQSLANSAHLDVLLAKDHYQVIETHCSVGE